MLEGYCKKNSIGKIISVCGRFYAMDRDKRWERTEAAYNLIINTKAKFFSNSAIGAIDLGYKRNETDEFISPTIIKSNDTETQIQENDCVVFMNFRSDRARQITDAILNNKFDGFQRDRQVKNLLLGRLRRCRCGPFWCCLG